MYGKGGWVIAPARELPTKRLTEAQKKANERARKKHEKYIAALTRKIERETKRLTKTLGVELYEFDWGSKAKYRDPYPEGQLDRRAFKVGDKEIEEYLQGSYWNENTEALQKLHRLVELGVPLEVTFSGFSASTLEPNSQQFLRDGPPLPDWLKKAIKV